MTVQQLMNLLENMNPNAEVKVQTWTDTFEIEQVYELGDEVILENH